MLRIRIFRQKVHLLERGRGWSGSVGLKVQTLFRKMKRRGGTWEGGESVIAKSVTRGRKHQGNSTRSRLEDRDGGATIRGNTHWVLHQSTDLIVLALFGRTHVRALCRCMVITEFDDVGNCNTAVNSRCSFYPAMSGSTQLALYIIGRRMLPLRPLNAAVEDPPASKPDLSTRRWLRMLAILQHLRIWHDLAHAAACCMVNSREDRWAHSDLPSGNRVLCDLGVGRVWLRA